MNFSRTATLGMALALGSLGATAGADAAKAASERWRFERAAGGGYAQSCGWERGQRVCATVYCGRGVDGYEVGLTGWTPRGRGDARNGAIAVDRFRRDAVYTRRDNPILGEVWEVDSPRATRRLIDRMKSGGRMAMDVAARGPAFQFTLAGSSDAISRLERRCARQAGYRGDDRRGGRWDPEDRAPRGPRPGLAADDDTLVIGDDDFQIVLRLGANDGPRRLSHRQVRQIVRDQGFQDIDDIDYREGRNVYVVEAENRRGRDVRLVINADTGEIIRRRRS